jgi:fructose-1-phosphate kinase PfkB-like protein
MLCGSVPPGVPSEFYARLVEAARKAHVPVMVDTDGEALERAIEAGPDIVTPNQQEAERLLSRALITRSHFVDAVARIKQMGAQSVILSLGARGAMAISREGSIYEITPPRVDALCPIGAGDALGAAYAWAIMERKEFVDAARWGVAAGTASARLPGISFASLEDTREVYGRVEVRRIQ